MTNIRVDCGRKLLIGAGLEVRCAIGRAGFVVAAQKREGDGATPLGVYPIRRLYYRADRLRWPGPVRLAHQALNPEDGWCDAPNDPQYNQWVRHPYPASAERLWRADPTYDLILVLGHNDRPVVPGAGSAIFLHIARGGAGGLSATAGCVAIEREALITLVGRLDRDDQIELIAG